MATTKRVYRIRYEEDGEEKLSGTMSLASAINTMKSYENSEKFKKLKVVDSGEFEG